MASPCYYHPDTVASATCVQCGLPICANCTDRVGEKTVCQKCVKVVRTRLEAQMAAAPAGAYGGPAASPGYGAGGYGATAGQYGGSPYGSSAAVAATTASDQKQLTLGIILAAVIGIIGGLIWEKMWFSLDIRIPFLFIGIGVAVGYGFHKGVGRGGSSMALIATGIMGVTFLLAHMLLAIDTTNAMKVGTGSPILGLSPTPDPGATFGDGFSKAMSSLPIFHWVSIAIGLGWCYRAVENQE